MIGYFLHTEFYVVILTFNLGNGTIHESLVNPSNGSIFSKIILRT